MLNHSAGNLVLSAVTPGSTIHYIKNGTGQVNGTGPLTVALAVGADGDTLEYWATLANYDDSAHHTIDNTREITFGGGGHWPPRNPV